jgi:hypothetical protein
MLDTLLMVNLSQVLRTIYTKTNLVDGILYFLTSGLKAWLL